MTTAIDLADNALSSKRPRFCHADEFVAEHPFERHVTTHELQVGFTQSGARHSDKDFIGKRNGSQRIAIQLQLSGVQSHGPHRENSSVELPDLPSHHRLKAAKGPIHRVFRAGDRFVNAKRSARSPITPVL